MINVLLILPSRSERRFLGKQPRVGPGAPSEGAPTKADLWRGPEHQHRQLIGANGSVGEGGLQQTSAHRYRCQCQHSQREQWRLFTSLPGCRAGSWFRHLLQRRSDQTDHFILINKLPQWYRQQQKRDYSVGVYLMRR